MHRKHNVQEASYLGHIAGKFPPTNHTVLPDVILGVKVFLASADGIGNEPPEPELAKLLYHIFNTEVVELKFAGFPTIRYLPYLPWKFV